MGIPVHEYPHQYFALCRLAMARSRRRVSLENLSANRYSRSDINWVIMDYLVSEGYPAAAEKFAQETNLGSPDDLESIRERVAVRDALHSGKVEEAIALINEIDHQVCCAHLPCLSFEMIIVSCTTHIPSGVDEINKLHFSPQYDLVLSFLPTLRILRPVHTVNKHPRRSSIKTSFSTSICCSCNSSNSYAASSSAQRTVRRLRAMNFARHWNLRQSSSHPKHLRKQSIRKRYSAQWRS